MKRWHLVWLGVIVLIAAAIFWIQFHDNPKSERFTLRNGMEVLVIPYGEVPAITHMVWYKIGAKDEQPGKSGLAHFLEHLMFKGTDSLKAGEFSETVARLGGNENAMTSQDYTTYFQNIARQHLERMMELEADRMKHLNFDDESFKNEQQVVLEERSSRMENNPRARLMEQLNAALFSSHPYGKPVIGWREEITALTADDAQNFYRTWYAPNNAILIVAGNITAHELKPLAEKYYGSLPASTLPPRNIPATPQVGEPKKIELRDKTVTEREWIRSFIAPSAIRGNTALSLPLSVLAYILGGSETSRLYQELVVRQHLAIDISTHYNPVSAEYTTFAVHAFPRSEASFEKMEQAVESILGDIKENGVTAEELERAKILLRASTIYSQDSFQEMAFAYGRALVSGLPASYIETLPNQITSITAEQVQEAAREVLIKERTVTGVLLPEDKSSKKP